MKKIIILAVAMFFLDNSYCQDKNLPAPEISKINENVISEEDKMDTFEEMVEDASKKIKEWAKKLKSTNPKYFKNEYQGSNKENSSENKVRTLEEELKSEEWKKEKEKLFKYINEGNPDKMREQQEIMKQKFPAIYKYGFLGFKFNEAKAFIWERKLSEAQKLLSEIIVEFRKRYPTPSDWEKLNKDDKLFFTEVFAKRGIITLFIDKNYLEAADDFKTGLLIIPKLEIDPHYHRMYAHLTTALVMSNRIKEAAYWYKKAFEVYPDFNKKPNEHTNLCKNIINAGYLENCPPCKDVAEKLFK